MKCIYKHLPDPTELKSKASSPRPFEHATKNGRRESTDHNEELSGLGIYLKNLGVNIADRVKKLLGYGNDSMDGK